MRNPGDKVSIDHPNYPGIWIVNRIGPKNTLVKRASGGPGVRVPHYLIIDPVDAVITADDRMYDLGEIVRIAEGAFRGLYVVIRDTGGDKVNVAKIGGDGGRYVRALRRRLEAVDPSEVLAVSA